VLDCGRGFDHVVGSEQEEKAIATTTSLGR
jgi:hypothetical protein